jgi:catechol 2,3-dioxygenase-like lactoylglutathione lyase family enzyme
MNRPGFLNGRADQAGIVVRDIDETERQYYDRFGMGDWKIYTYGPGILSYMTRNGKPAFYSMKVALNNFGETRIELIQQLEGDTVYAEFIRDHGYGIHHLGIYLPDIRTALKEALAAGFGITMEGAGFGLDGDGYFAYLDTDRQLGTTYELIERPKRRHEPEAVFPC